MSGKIISVHSFRGGTGKSNISANLSYMLAKAGKRVCVVDTDIQSPGIHMLFKHEQPSTGATLNDFLWGDKSIDDVAMDVSERLDLPEKQLFLIPCSINMGDITRILKQGYDISTLAKGFKDIRQHLNLDYLILDTHPGLDEETLLAISISDILLIILRPDQQDFQGTSVTVDISKRLKVDKTYLVMNRLLNAQDRKKEMEKKMQDAFGCEVAAILPNCEELAELGSSGLLSRCLPDSEWVSGLEQVRKLID
jgi:MinD-like ATPase involved in chromosome partitioning or flagellar assembly